MKTFDIISMETLNIEGWFQNKKWSPKLQKIGLYKLISMIKYKAEWYGRTFIQIDPFTDPQEHVTTADTYTNTYHQTYENGHVQNAENTITETLMPQ